MENATNQPIMHSFIHSQTSQASSKEGWPVQHHSTWQAGGRRAALANGEELGARRAGLDLDAGVIDSAGVGELQLHLRSRN